MQAINSNIILKGSTKENETSGGIKLPDNVHVDTQPFTVISVGEGRIAFNGERVPMKTVVGDKVIISNTTLTSLMVKGEEFFSCSEDAVIAIL